MAAGDSWSLQQLVRYLTEIGPAPDSACDRETTLRIGVERAAEALDAEVGALVLDGRVLCSIGFGSAKVDESELLAVVEGRSERLLVPGLGECNCSAASVGNAGHLLLARSEEPFSREEQTIVRALGRILALSLRSVEAVAAERSLRRESERRAHEALRDPLTGLPNRALFLDRLELAVQRQDRRGGSVAVLFMDMDGFKVVNDTLGHSSGDELLRSVAARLSGAIRSADTLARLGGDEFAILIEDVLELEVAYAVAERVREVLVAPFDVCGRPVSIAVSIGIATGPRPGEAPDVLLRDADLAMYRAKAEEPGGYRVFVPGMHEDLVERIALESELRETIGQGGLTCVYQPIVDLHSGGICGLESLVRWQHPERGLLGPAAFLALAERAGLMTSLGNWVLDETCRQFACWRNVLPPGTSVSVNLASSQIAWGGLVGLVEKTLSDYCVDPSKLVLEITETAVVAARSQGEACLAALRQIGTPLALDDFGTGYSSLSRLRELPVDILKIDRSFVSGIPQDPKMRVLAANIVGLARDLDLVTVAEGIETPDERAALLECGCEHGQGYYFSHPLAPSELEELALRSSNLPLRTEAAGRALSPVHV